MASYRSVRMLLQPVMVNNKVLAARTDKIDRGLAGEKCGRSPLMGVIEFFFIENLQNL
ncbi:MAG: hypothetical protein GDA48_26020 [Hormoscilla sp. GM102CHS1]|nr:hypothetical protein [Hormoscilla sp. GM102CHS1]